MEMPILNNEQAQSVVDYVDSLKMGAEDSYRLLWHIMNLFACDPDTIEPLYKNIAEALKKYAQEFKEAAQC